MAGSLEHFPDQLDDLFFVVDDEHARHGVFPACAPERCSAQARPLRLLRQ